jgi:hypothetical protein
VRQYAAEAPPSDEVFKVLARLGELLCGFRGRRDRLPVRPLRSRVAPDGTVYGVNDKRTVDSKASVPTAGSGVR